MKDTADATSGNTKLDELLERAKQDDKDAFVELITEYEYIIRSIVRTFLRRIDGHDENDLVNEVIIRAYKVIPGFRGDDVAFKYFLRRTTKGLCLNLINKPKHDLQEFKEDAQDTLPGPDGGYVTCECFGASCGCGGSMPGTRRPWRA